jgi:hypothetical protein
VGIFFGINLRQQRPQHRPGIWIDQDVASTCLELKAGSNYTSGVADDTDMLTEFGAPPRRPVSHDVGFAHFILCLSICPLSKLNLQIARSPKIPGTPTRPPRTLNLKSKLRPRIPATVSTVVGQDGQSVEDAPAQEASRKIEKSEGSCERTNAGDVAKSLLDHGKSMVRKCKQY